MPCIKVGLNEWVVINKGKHNTFTLWTDGLSGCVGVAITTEDRAFMTHISSDVNWKKEVEEPFLKAITKLGDLAEVEICYVVIGDDTLTPLANAVLDTLNTIADQYKWESDPILRDKHTGVRAYLEQGRFQIQLRTKMGHQTDWGENQNSKQGVKYVESQGFFPPKGYPAEV